MGLGSTAKKIQALSDHAETMYKQVQELQKRIFHLEEEVDDTHDTVKRLDHQLSEQRALLLAIAETQGIDGEEVLAEAAIDEAETDEEPADTTTADAAGESTGDTETTTDSSNTQ